MAKKTKKSHPISIRMDKPTFDRLKQFCEDSGHSKTVAIERAINMYIDDYDDKKKQLEKLWESSLVRYMNYCVIRNDNLICI